MMQPVDRDSNEVFKENTVREMERHKKEPNRTSRTENSHFEIKIPS